MAGSGNRYFIINKPYNMTSQFISAHEEDLLGDLDFNFPEGTHAIGRLDKNSEGLLILTTNKKVTKLLFQDAEPHKRVYLVMVRNVVTEDTLNRLRTGVPIRITNGEFYIAACSEITIETNPGKYVNFGYQLPAHVPHTWLRISLTEGKFRQVRKMVAAVHHRCIRLVRIAIEDIELDNLAPGCIREMDEKDFFKKLSITQREDINTKG